jgi:hypothetical protein
VPTEVNQLGRIGVFDRRFLACRYSVLDSQLDAATTLSTVRAAVRARRLVTMASLSTVQSLKDAREQLVSARDIRLVSG